MEDLARKGPEVKEFISKLIALDERNRFTATEALDSGFFSNRPYPCQPDQIKMPKCDAENPQHHFVIRKEREAHELMSK